jgi:DNA modification methylase
VPVGEVLVRQSSEPGDLVVDPFTGSGAFGVAAVALGRCFAGSDTSRQAFDVAGRRLDEAGARRCKLLPEARETWNLSTRAHTIRGGEAA